MKTIKNKNKMMIINKKLINNKKKLKLNMNMIKN